ncbi:beta-lactamase/transpeptidase-like protein [Teratosphaeria nubilosa]|uniref:Beta-lactamase/transpeptidase-like protein n=1 Tax=Teratosphaeria nubilosa TaxID=161662 RepID=A0A6G1LP88_9PEZI|nr:beta-lactamase/transpeptidase-like protein [Teratosphaeria nubilosa]
MTATSPDVDRILASVPHLQSGPGGAIGVVKDGKVVGTRIWGYADLDRRVPMTAQTHFPICSISKQMVCLVMQSLLQKLAPPMLERKIDPAEQFEEELRRLLPNLKDRGDLRFADLYNMQSGIRDYWAMTTLWGARPDGPFSLLHEAPQSLDRVRSFHFTPGTEYSYSNVNFHVLGRILENVSGISLDQLLVERLFIPAGMSSAKLCPNTSGLPLPLVGYEGNAKVGYFAATNRIEWAGDAGIAASLEDMLAYEQYLDRSLLDTESLYAQTSKRQTFRDGKPADYGYGLARAKMAGREAIMHGGALRGFRHLRVQLPSERLSVVALHNYELDPTMPIEHVVKKLLGWEEPKKSTFQPSAQWKGDFLDEDSQLYLEVKPGDQDKPGKVSINYGPGNGGETVTLTSETEAANPGMKVRLENDVLHVERIKDNRTLRATRIQPLEDAALAEAASSVYAGTYHCGESESTFNVTHEGGALYGSFDGFLGQGPIWLMRCLGRDVWALGNPRAMDSTPPGDWTIVFRREEGGRVSGCTVGCWLARKVEYVRL